MNDPSLRALFDAVPEAVALVDYVDGDPIVRRVNGTFEECFGYDAATLRGESINDFVVPDDDQRRAVAAEIDATASAGDPVEREVTRQTADGLRDFLFRASPFEQDGTVKSVGIYVDVTERRRERQRYELLIEETSDVLTVLEPDGTIRYESPSVESVLGYDPEELVGEDAFDYVHPDDRDDVSTEFTRALNDPDATPHVEYRFRAADGSYRTLESTGSNYIDHPEIQGFVVTSHDVTERERRERELERQNERLDEFAGIISHDLRNPLNVAAGRLDLLAEECDSEHIPVVREALERIETLVDDTLTLARHGQTIEEPEPVDLQTVVERAWQGVDTGSAALDTGDLGRVRADADRVRELLENLFRNAVEHGAQDTDSQAQAADQGGEAGHESDTEPCVRVHVQCTDGGFFVADDGPGIPPDERDAVFEAGHTTEADGTGMGLAIVEQIADAHGWDVAVTESEAGGARFEFTGVDWP